jgi:hypothetical protein
LTSSLQNSEGVFELALPFDGSTGISATNTKDTGAFVDAILRGGDKYFGKTASLVAETIPEEERLRVWAKGEQFFGVKSRTE